MILGIAITITGTPEYAGGGTVPPPTTNHIQNEDGTNLLTEAGEKLTQES